MNELRRDVWRKNKNKLKGPRSYGTRKTTYERRNRRDARRETYATTNDNRSEAMDVERKHAHEAMAEKKKNAKEDKLRQKKANNSTVI